jgi:hypothetical protein
MTKGTVMVTDPTFGEALDETTGDTGFAALIADAAETTFGEALDETTGDTEFAALIAPESE